MKVKDDPKLMAIIQDSLNMLDKIQEILNTVNENHKEKNIFHSDGSEIAD